MVANPGKIRRQLEKAQSDVAYLVEHMDEVDNDVIVDHFQRIYSLIAKICTQTKIVDLRK